MTTEPDFTQFDILFSSQAAGKQLKWRSTEHCFANKASCFELSPDGHSISVGDQTGQLSILRILENRTLAVCNQIQQHQQAKLADITFNPTSDLIATCSNANDIELTSFNAKQSEIGSKKMRMSMSEPVRALTFMEDLANRSNILFSGVGKQICIIDCSSATIFRILKGHTGSITSFCTWGGCMFASSSLDKTIRIWDMRVSDAVKVFDPLSKPSVSSAFHINSSGRILLRGDATGKVHIFDTSSLKVVTSKLVVSGPVTCLRLANEKHFVAVADATSLNICDLHRMMERRVITKTTSKCFAIRWNPICPIFCTLDDESQLRLWQLIYDDGNELDDAN